MWGITRYVLLKYVLRTTEADVSPEAPQVAPCSIKNLGTPESAPNLGKNYGDAVPADI